MTIPNPENPQPKTGEPIDPANQPDVNEDEDAAQNEDVNETGEGEDAES